MFDTKTWIEFAVSFVHGAIIYAGSINPLAPPTQELLKSYILNGAELSGVKDMKYITTLMDGKQDLPPGAYDLKNVTPADKAKFLKKARESNLTLENSKSAMAISTLSYLVLA